MCAVHSQDPGYNKQKQIFLFFSVCSANDIEGCRVESQGQRDYKWEICWKEDVILIRPSLHNRQDSDQVLICVLNKFLILRPKIRPKNKIFIFFVVCRLSISFQLSMDSKIK